MNKELARTLRSQQSRLDDYHRGIASNMIELAHPRGRFNPAEYPRLMRKQMTNLEARNQPWRAFKR